MDPKIRHLLALALALNTTDGFVSPLLASGEGEGGGGGGGENKSDGGAKTFSQEDVNGLLARERRTWEGKLAEATTKANADLADVRAKLDALEGEKKLEGVTGKDREIEKLRQTIAKMESDGKALGEARTKAEQDRDAALTRYRTHRASEQARDALIKAGALSDPKALNLATRTLLADGKAEIAEDAEGNLTVSLVLDGKRYDALDQASKTWLQSNELFLKAAGGGGGTKAPNGSGGGGGKPLAEASFDQLAAMALAEGKS